MRRNAVVFLEFFSGTFREIWAKILRTPKNLPAPTPMGASMTATLLKSRIMTIELLFYFLCLLLKLGEARSGVRRKFSWGGFIQWHMVVISIWCALFVTSQHGVIFMFPN